VAASTHAMVCAHLQRIVLHIVFQDPALAGWEIASDSNALLPNAETVAHKIYELVRKDAVKHHPTEYLASLSKNFEKCACLIRRICAPEPSQEPGRFEDLPLFNPSGTTP
jgi:hypothetical protein